MSRKIDLRRNGEKIGEILRRLMLCIGIAFVALGVVGIFLPNSSIPVIHWIVVGTIFILVASLSRSDWFSNFRNGMKFRY